MSEFFGKLGNNLSLRSSDQALSVLGDIDVHVPPRGGGHGRKSDHGERWCIVHYLETLIRHGELVLPCSVRKEERPDFVLSSRPETIGLEVTEAMRTEAGQRDAMAADMPPGTIPGLAHSDEDPRELISDPGEDLKGRGWNGPETEQDWAVEIGSAIWSKAKALNKPGFQFQNTCELLVYDNTDAGLARLKHLDASHVSEHLVPRVQPERLKLELQHSYRAVHILTWRQLLQDVFGRLNILPVVSRRT